MRRALLAVLAGGTLLTGGACDGGAKNTADAAAASSVAPSRVPDQTLPPLPDYSADTKQVCGRLQAVYTGELRAFGTAVGKMVSYKEAKQTAEAQTAANTAAGQLKAAGAKIRQETAAAQLGSFFRIEEVVKKISRQILLDEVEVFPLDIILIVRFTPKIKVMPTIDLRAAFQALVHVCHFILPRPRK